MGCHTRRYRRLNACSIAGLRKFGDGRVGSSSLLFLMSNTDLAVWLCEFFCFSGDYILSWTSLRVSNRQGNPESFPMCNMSHHLFLQPFGRSGFVASSKSNGRKRSQSDCINQNICFILLCRSVNGGHIFRTTCVSQLWYNFLLDFLLLISTRSTRGANLAKLCTLA